MKVLGAIHAHQENRTLNFSKLTVANTVDTQGSPPVSFLTGPQVTLFCTAMCPGRAGLQAQPQEVTRDCSRCSCCSPSYQYLGSTGAQGTVLANRGEGAVRQICPGARGKGFTPRVKRSSLLLGIILSACNAYCCGRHLAAVKEQS